MGVVGIRTCYEKNKLDVLEDEEIKEDKLKLIMFADVGRGGALVETMTFDRRVVGSTPALVAM